MAGLLALPLSDASPKEEAHAREAPGLARLSHAGTHHLLGIVYAADEKSAEAAAIAEYKISEDMRRHLIVRPNDD